MKRRTRQFTYRFLKVLLLQAILVPMALLQADEVLEPDTSTVNWDCRWVGTASDSTSVVYCVVEE